MSRRILIVVGVECALILLLGCRSSAGTLVLATTTSVANSGLLDRVLPAYGAQSVRATPVGSGRALNMLEGDRADVVISHAPEQEAKALHAHPTWFYRKILYNDFLIVGPASDPAGIAGLTDAVAAMKRILESHQRFLSRGDESDRGTFEMLSPSLRLRIVVAGDPVLLNTYAVLAAPSNDQGLRFARWLAEGEGRRALADTLRYGQVRGFTLWPPDRDGTRPDSRPF